MKRDAYVRLGIQREENLAVCSSLKAAPRLAPSTVGFWLATVTDNAAILLAGSREHVIGASPPDTDSFDLPYTLDPIGSMRRWNEMIEGPELPRDLPIEIWQAIVLLSAEDFSRFADLPQVRGIANYRNRLRIDSHVADRLSQFVGHRVPLEVLLLGSPLWVESV